MIVYRICLLHMYLCFSVCLIWICSLALCDQYRYTVHIKLFVLFLINSRSKILKKKVICCISDDKKQGTKKLCILRRSLLHSFRTTWKYDSNIVFIMLWLKMYGQYGFVSKYFKLFIYIFTNFHVYYTIQLFTFDNTL